MKGNTMLLVRYNTPPSIMATTMPRKTTMSCCVPIVCACMAAYCNMPGVGSGEKSFLDRHLSEMGRDMQTVLYSCPTQSFSENDCSRRDVTISVAERLPEGLYSASAPDRTGPMLS